MNLYLFNVRDVTFVNVPKLDHKMFKEFCKSKNMQSLKNLRVVDCPSITTESLKFLLTLKSFPMLDLNSFLKTNVLLINDTIMGLLA